MDIYTVTFCTQDQDVGANIFWHTFIFLSRFDHTTKKMKVVDTWGFYGPPSSSIGTMAHSAKMALALDVDFYGNHGTLRHEEVRYLDAGRGLHGVTFELTEEKFNELQAKCIATRQKEFDAIADISEKLQLKGKPAGRFRNYPQENYANLFFNLEKAAAAEQKRASRLSEFQLSPLPGANTCKAQAIKLLTDILTPEQVARVTSWHGSVSRLSGKMENIYLHSTGPLRQHVKQSGDVVNFRSLEDEGVNLYWTLPPQEVEVLNYETLEYFHIDPNHCDEIKLLVSRLQQFEWYFINAKLPPELEVHRQTMLTTLQVYVQSFSCLAPKPVKEASVMKHKYIRWLMFCAPDSDEKLLLDQIATLKEFLDRMCIAMTEKFDGADDVNAIKNNIELLARYLPEQSRRELCGIAGVNFDVVEEDLVLVL